MPRPIQRVEAADQEWRAWRKELEVRHKLAQDQKMYDEWKGRAQAVHQSYSPRHSFERMMTVRFRQRYARDE